MCFTKKSLLTLYFATGSAHKRREVQHFTSLMHRGEALRIGEIESIASYPEHGDTLYANAQEKLMYGRKFVADDCMVFSEDTGLFVASLAGAPGVYTSRYAGKGARSDENMRKLLKKLQDISCRDAIFRTVMMLYDPLGSKYMTFEGHCEGSIAREMSEDKNGFGYDRVFIPKGEQETFAQLPAHKKAQMSHRRAAFEKIIAYLGEEGVLK